MEIIGSIYRIENILNGKNYIGQTTRDINLRFKEHILESKNPKTRLHIAMHRYGIENFKLYLLDKCPISELNTKEIYYINMYDSYVEGYNSTKGGGNTKSRLFSLEDSRQEILDLYTEDKYSINTIAKSYNVDKKVIKNLIIACGYQLRPVKQLILNQLEEDELIQKFNLGISLNKLSSQYDVSSSTLKRYLESRQVEVPSKYFFLRDNERCKELLNDFYNTSLSYKDLMSKYSISFNTLKTVLGNNKRPHRKKLQTFSVDQIATILSLRKNGETIKSIANFYKVDKGTIRRVLKRYCT